MTQETVSTVQKPDSDEYIVHWAQWWGITLVRVLGTTSGTPERVRAYDVHQDAKGTLMHCLGLAEKEAHHG